MSSKAPPPMVPSKCWSDFQTSLLMVLIGECLVMGVLVWEFWRVWSGWFIPWTFFLGWFEYEGAALAAYGAWAGFGQMFCVTSKRPLGMYDPLYMDTASKLGTILNYNIMVIVTMYVPPPFFWPFNPQPYVITALGVFGLLGYLDLSAMKPPAWLK